MTQLKSTRHDGAVKSSLAPSVAADPHEPPERVRGQWVVRVPLAALDHRSNGGLGHRKLGLLLVLETYARAHAYCWAGDEELAAAFGCKRGALSGLLGELEDDGWIRRVPPPRGQPGRVGILMLKRLDPDLPTADPADPADVIALLGRATEGPGRARPPGRDRVQETERDRVQETGRRIRTNPNHDEETLTFARAGGGDPEPEAIPDPIEPPQTEPAPGPLAPPAPPEVSDFNPAPAEVTVAVLAAQAPAPEAESDPAPTPEQVEAELAELEAKIARQSPRPPSAMERIRLKNLRDLKAGTWRPDRLAGGASPPVPAATPRLDSWPSATGPVETADLIRRLASPGSGAEAVEAAAERVAARLKDAHSLPFYRKAFARVQSGELPVVLALSAWKKASGGTARSPGAVFNASLKGGARR